MAFLQERARRRQPRPSAAAATAAPAPWFPTEIPETAVTHRPRAARAGRRRARPARRSGPAAWTAWACRSRARSPPDEAHAAGPGAGPAHRPRLGTAAARRCCAADAPADPELLRACVPVLARLGLGAAARRRRGRAVARHGPQLVQSARRRGWPQIGRLPFLGTLDLVDGGPTGEPGGNSAFRLAGVWERLAVGPELASAAGRARRAGAARRRPRRLPVDPDRGGPGAAPGRGARACCRSRSPSRADTARAGARATAIVTT